MNSNKGKAMSTDQHYATPLINSTRSMNQNNTTSQQQNKKVSVDESKVIKIDNLLTGPNKANSTLENDPFLKTQLNLLAGQDQRMRALVKRVEKNQKQTQNLLDQIEKEDLLVDQSKLTEVMKRAEQLEDEQDIYRQIYEEDHQEDGLEIVPEIKQGETFQMTTSIVSKEESEEQHSLIEPTITMNQQASEGLTAPTPLGQDYTTAYRESVIDNKRYKLFVTDAHKAKDKSVTMVNKLMEHAKKTGDKKAVTTL